MSGNVRDLARAIDFVLQTALNRESTVTVERNEMNEVVLLVDDEIGVAINPDNGEFYDVGR